MSAITFRLCGPGLEGQTPGDLATLFGACMHALAPAEKRALRQLANLRDQALAAQVGEVEVEAAPGDDPRDALMQTRDARTPHEIMLEAAMNFRCSACDAEAGKPCYTPGAPGSVHVARTEAAGYAGRNLTRLEPSR